MRVLIYGGQGYLGWPLSIHLLAKGHTVKTFDNNLRERLVRSVGGESLTPISENRRNILRDMGGDMDWSDTAHHHCVESDIEMFQPDTIVHLGEIPSAPYSMMGPKEAFLTQYNNVLGTLNILWAIKKINPNIALLKLGTMGEFGTPNVDIPEGKFEIEYKGRKDVMPFPKQPGSYYHLSKCHDSNNIEFACKVWGLSSTDIMQGVVYGANIPETQNDEKLNTRYDYDECWGTFINRLCLQALLNIPLTVYGKGLQKRGFLPLKDSIQCLTLAIENPPKEGEYRVLNQFEEVYILEDLAKLISKVSVEMGYKGEIVHLQNPRVESEDHYYKPEHKKLLELGYEPTKDIETEIRDTMAYIDRYKNDAILKVIMPRTNWK